MTNPQTLDAIAHDGTGLRVCLEWDNDRYHHHVEWVAGELVTRLFESPKAARDDSEANRPVFQQLSVESHSLETQVALAVGMSGQSHWSMSIEIDAALRTVIFDVACRLTEPVNNLASCYRLLVPVNRLEGRECELHAVGHPCRLEVDSSAQSEVVQLKIKGDQLLLIPQPPDGNLPTTVRWRYRVIG